MALGEELVKVAIEIPAGRKIISGIQILLDLIAEKHKGNKNRHYLSISFSLSQLK